MQPVPMAGEKVLLLLFTGCIGRKQEVLRRTGWSQPKRELTLDISCMFLLKVAYGSGNFQCTPLAKLRWWKKTYLCNMLKISLMQWGVLENLGKHQHPPPTKGLAG